MECKYFFPGLFEHCGSSYKLPFTLFRLREKRPERPVPSLKPFLIEPAPGQASRSWRTYYHYYGKFLSIIASYDFAAYDS